MKNTSYCGYYFIKFRIYLMEKYNFYEETARKLDFQ